MAVKVSYVSSSQFLIQQSFFFYHLFKVLSGCVPSMRDSNGKIQVIKKTKSVNQLKKKKITANGTQANCLCIYSYLRGFI